MRLSLKRVIDRENLLLRKYRNSPTLIRTVPCPSEQKAHKILGKVAVGVVRESWKFSGRVRVY